MPVIGRLDEQVDEVLIKPLSKRHEGEDGTPPDPAPQAPPPDASEKTTAEDGRTRGRRELPVWLL